MPRYLFNVETTYAVEADSEEEAEQLFEKGHREYVTSDVLFVGEE